MLRSSGRMRSDHLFVVAKIYWIKARYERKAEQTIKVIRVSELLKREKADVYRELVEDEWRALTMRAVGSVENERWSFKCTVLRIPEKVCGVKKVWPRRRESEWWCIKTTVAVREKKKYTYLMLFIRFYMKITIASIIWNSGSPTGKTA